MGFEDLRAGVVTCPHCLEIYWSEDGHPDNECPGMIKADEYNQTRREIFEEEWDVEAEDRAATVIQILINHPHFSYLEAMEKLEDPEFLEKMLEKGE